MHEEFCQFTEVQQIAFWLFIINLLSCQFRESAIELPPLSALKTKSAHNALRDMWGWIATHTSFQVVNICPRKPCSLRKLSLRHTMLLPKLADQLRKGRRIAYSHFMIIQAFCFSFCDEFVSYTPIIQGFC